MKNHLGVSEVCISVLTPTIRYDGLPLVERALKRQTFKNWEWIIGSPHKPENISIPFVWVKDLGKKKGECWSLNKTYNRMIARAKGDLIVSWQDYTFAIPEALEKFWFHFEKEPKTLVSAVGNKYQDDSWQVMTWKDPRERDDQGTYYPCYWSDIEANLCSIPKKALYDVGGFDESMDRFFGLDFFSVANRINDFGGYDFKLDQTIKSYSLEHKRVSPRWDEDNWMKDNRYNLHVARLKKEGKWPVLNYLPCK